MNGWLIALIVFSVFLVLLVIAVTIVYFVYILPNQQTSEETDEQKYPYPPVSPPPVSPQPYVDFSNAPIYSLENQPITISLSQLVGPNRGMIPVFKSIN